MNSYNSVLITKKYSYTKNLLPNGFVYKFLLVFIRKLYDVTKY